MHKKKTFIVLCCIFVAFKWDHFRWFIWFVEVYSFEGCNALKKRESSRNKRNKRKEKKLELLMKRIFWKEVNTLFNFGEIFFSICYQICIYLYLFSSMKTFNNFYVWSSIYSDSRKKLTMFITLFIVNYWLIWISQFFFSTSVKSYEYTNISYKINEYN